MCTILFLSFKAAKSPNPREPLREIKNMPQFKRTTRQTVDIFQLALRWAEDLENHISIEDVNALKRIHKQVIRKFNNENNKQTTLTQFYLSED